MIEAAQIVEEGKNKRLAQGLSLRGLAAIIGVSPSTLSRLERGIGDPEVRVLNRLNRWVSGEDLPAPESSRHSETIKILNNLIAVIKYRIKTLEEGE